MKKSGMGAPSSKIRPMVTPAGLPKATHGEKRQSAIGSITTEGRTLDDQALDWQIELANRVERALWRGEITQINIIALCDAVRSGARHRAALQRQVNIEWIFSIVLLAIILLLLVYIFAR